MARTSPLLPTHTDSLINETRFIVIPRAFYILVIWKEHKLEKERIKSWLAIMEHFQWESLRSVP